MSNLVANCPRCKVNDITFDVVAQNDLGTEYGWQRRYEVFSICRACERSTVFVVYQKEAGGTCELFLRSNKLTSSKSAINSIVDVKGYISLKDTGVEPPPDYLPEAVDAAFREGAACMAIGCFNAAATMFRLCLDMATTSLLPHEDVNGLNNKIRRSLGLRLGWLYDHGYIPESLRDLSSCIKDDGNDGAHEGTLTEVDAEDILDFSYVLLERIYTEPKRIELATQRRVSRRQKAKT
ncbi:DUF4145 domain-containing protein [Vibrio vulnificus]|nr:DUF4145 domain-containing protein [Vibrio vulnificus]EKA6052397.1 DUF4145 domain-containing protein [Vibrio vulnificus]ELB7646135.1 DUF4145 domain-containing protein [Vibrio vulnificus]